MAEAGTSFVDSVESITSPNENLTEEDEAAHCKDKKEFLRKTKKLQKRTNHVNILVLGLTGAGKSTLVNAMMGDIVTQAQAGARPCQTGIQYYEGEHDSIEIKIHDTAGFGDGAISKKEILKDISKNAPKEGYDLILIALRMDNRFDEKVTEMLSSLGQFMDRGDKWKRTIMVLTFANSFVGQIKNENDYTEEQVKDKLQEEKGIFKKLFQEHTKKDDDDIPFVLAGSKKERNLPTNDDWLITLWEQSILQCRTKAKPFVKCLAIYRLINQLRLKVRSIFFSSNEESIEPDGSEEGSDSEDKEYISSEEKEEEGISSDDDGLQHVVMDLVQEVTALLPKH